MEHQPPHKKVATDGPINMPASNSLPPEIRGVPAGAPTASGDSDAGASPSSGQMSCEGISEREEKRKKRRSSEKGRGGRRKSDVVIDGKVKDGCFVVEKRLSDPYDDFTTSIGGDDCEEADFRCYGPGGFAGDFSVCAFSSPS
ncbi:hypothetical protein RHMOL_Rhmol04G0069700 [Rhododendron molle]|uniref:Uncharacterized protein n=1 Tax=Rhododendron molle TaxID=49168 RepID=A0ACC0NYZ9_RHOML|nr:hypothetical protein RHMOL_Rhmol04G0069700 [Rhododendron molle]